MAGFLQDIRSSMRMLAKGPGTSAMIIVQLAMGVGANMAIFSLIRGILMRPVAGVQVPERMVRFLRIEAGDQGPNFSYPDYTDYRDRTRLFAGVAAESPAAFSLAGRAAQRIRGALVTGTYFKVLGVKPELGRLLGPEDDQVVGAHWVAVISYGLWQRAFGGESSLLGKSISLNGHDYKVIGVAARDFRGTNLDSSNEVWLPLMMQPQAVPRLSANILGDRMAGWLSIYGRLRPGVSIGAAKAEIAAIAQRLARAYPDTNGGRAAEIAGEIGLYPGERANMGRLFSILFGAVGLLLLIACCNVANLLLAGAMGRRREVAIRLALGGSRLRVVRQLVTESLGLGCVASVIAMLIAPWSVALVARFLPPAHGGLKEFVRIDPVVLVFALVLSAVSTVTCSLVPALAASKTQIGAVLRESSPASTPRQSWFAHSLMMVQVTLSIMLLIGASLAVRTIQRALTEAKGFESGHVLVASLDLSILNYPEARARSFCTQLLDLLTAVPGVRAASLSKTYPASGWSDRGPIFDEGQDPGTEEMRRVSDRGVLVERNTVSPGYFRALSIPVLAGRDFDRRDAAGAHPVAIVSAALAARLWSGESPLGKRIEVPGYRGPRQPPREVIGVVGDVKYRSLLADRPLMLYLPLQQNREVFLSLEARAEGDPAALVPAIERTVSSLDRHMPVYSATTLTGQVAASLWEQRAVAGLMGIFSVLALLVAGVGLYSVVAQSVAGRTHEVAIRMALGAQPGDVLRIVAAKAMLLAVAGVLLGIIGTLMLRRLLTSFLYGVSATDPVSLVATAGLLLAVSLAASYLPARAGARMDPVAVLRQP
jgi:predicted permease